MNPEHDRDRTIDLRVTEMRPEVSAAASSWRAAQRSALLDFIETGERPRSAGVEGGEPVVGSALTSRTRTARQQRRKIAAAASIALLAIGLAGIARSMDRAEAPGTSKESELSAPASSFDSAAVVDLPDSVAGSLVEPGVSVSPEVVALLALPTCPNDGGLATWAAQHLDWWTWLDPADAVAADFTVVTRSVAVDIAAVGQATCSTAISLGDAVAWGLADGSGAWVARAAGVPDPDEYEWPDSGPDAETRLEGQLGTGQQFTGYRIDAIDDGRTQIGVFNSSEKSAPDPIYVVELAEAVPLASPTDPGRLWWLRTTSGQLDERLTGPADPFSLPVVAPRSFGRCTVVYGLTNEFGQTAESVDYCNSTSTITKTFGVVDGEPISSDGMDMLVDRSESAVVRIGLAVDAPVLIADESVSEAELALMYVSIPMVQEMAHGGADTFEASGWPIPNAEPGVDPSTVIELGTVRMLGLDDHSIELAARAEVCLVDPTDALVDCGDIAESRRSGLATTKLADGSVVVYGFVDVGVDVRLEIENGPVVVSTSPSDSGLLLVAFRPVVEFASFGLGDQVDVVLRSKLDGSEVDRFVVDLT